LNDKQNEKKKEEKYPRYAKKIIINTAEAKE
jgi:hypothetical protein